MVNNTEKKVIKMHHQHQKTPTDKNQNDKQHQATRTKTTKNTNQQETKMTNNTNQQEPYDDYNLHITCKVPIYTSLMNCVTLIP